MKVVLLDPSLKNNRGELSDNLGDLIINGFVTLVLRELFPKEEIVRIATHDFPSKNEKALIKQSAHCFLGGSNLLNSTVNIYNNWKFDRNFRDTLFSSRSEAIALGLGWGEYQGEPNFQSRFFYKKRLSKTAIHSVRDHYSLSQFEKIGSLRAINTGCPSTWGLQATLVHRYQKTLPDVCLFTLTDYSASPAHDQALVEELLKHFKVLLYFPQGKGDKSYLKKLPVYQKNPTRFEFLEHDLNDFKKALKPGEIIYVGTRLHAGILALNQQIESLIIGIDNRALEMKKDIHLPVIERADLKGLSDWLQGKTIFDQQKIVLPLTEIAKWKEQFWA